MYCYRSYSDDDNQNFDMTWIYCDKCDKKMHLQCVPKKHLRAIDCEDIFEADEDNDIDFISEVCYDPTE